MLENGKWIWAGVEVGDYQQFYICDHPDLNTLISRAKGSLRNYCKTRGLDWHIVSARCYAGTRSESIIIMRVR